MRFDDYTEMGGVGEAFLTTHWSLIENIGTTGTDKDRALKALRRKYGWQMAIGDCFSRLTGKMKRRQYIRVERPKG